MKKALFFALSVLFIVGCSNPRVDTSSDEKMKASIEKVRASLPEEEKVQFDEALQILAFKDFNFGDIMNPAGPANIEAKMKESINGKTGAEIIDAAEQVKKERAEREKQQALSEIKELKEKQANAEVAKKELAAFKVIRSRFYIQKKEFGMDQPIIELDVINNTSYPISRAYFRGTLASPGRAVPWHQDEFNYKIPGGLEPREKAHWSLAPNMFSDWGRIDAPKDAIFTVEVVRLDGADGKPLYANDFSERDAERLSELMKKYPN